MYLVELLCFPVLVEWPSVLAWPKSSFVFFYTMTLVLIYLSLTLFETILLDHIVTAVVSVCISKKLTKIGEFLCSHFNIEDRRKYAFSVYYAYCSRKVKRQLKQKKIRAAYGEGAVTD